MPEPAINSPYAMQLRQAERQVLSFAVECSEDLEQAAARLGVSLEFLETRIDVLGGVLPDTKPKEPSLERPTTARLPAMPLRTPPVVMAPPPPPPRQWPPPPIEFEPATPRPRVSDELRAPANDVIKIDELINLATSVEEDGGLELAKFRRAVAHEVPPPEDADEELDEEVEEPDEEPDEEEPDEDEPPDDPPDEELPDDDDSEAAMLARARPWDVDPDEVPDDAPPQSDKPKVGRPPATSPDPAKFCTYRDVVALTGLSVSTVHKLRNEGKLTPFKQGGVLLFHRAEVDMVAQFLRARSRR
jgi:predicted DNA-binding transcriptional regulator AlpA